MAFLAFEARSPKGHVMVKQNVVADLRRLAYYHTVAMVNKQPTSDLRPRMDFDMCEKACYLREKACQPTTTMSPQPMRDSMRPNGVQTRVKQGIQYVTRRGVFS